MKGDNLDIKLREKLGHMSVDPPAHIWERIEKGLAAASPVLPGEEVRAARVKPLRRRVLLWSSAAAACLVAGVVSFSLLDKPTPDAPVAGNAPIKTELTPRPSASDAGLPVREEVQETYTVQHRSEKQFVPPTVRPFDELPADEGTALIAKEDAAAGTENDNNPDARRQDSTQSAGNAGGDSIKDKTSDMKERERSAVTYGDLRSVADEDATQYRARRRTPVSTSLFAANFGGINLGGDVMDNTRVANETPGQSNAAVKMRHKMPLTFGVNVSYGLTDRLAVETGLAYTYLYSESETTKSSEGKFEQKLHYLGVPVSVRYDIWKHRILKVYAGVGGAIEICLDAKEINKYAFYPTETVPIDAEGLQLSVNASAGVQVKLDDMFGLYLEPELNYFFDSPGQPESYRTQNPLSFSVKAGLRINLR